MCKHLLKMVKTILSHRWQIRQHLRLLVTRQYGDNNVLLLGNFRDRSYHSRWVLELLRHELPFTWEWFSPYFFVVNTFNVQLNQWFCPVRLVPGTNVIMFWEKNIIYTERLSLQGHKKDSAEPSSPQTPMIACMNNFGMHIRLWFKKLVQL